MTNILDRNTKKLNNLNFEKKKEVVAYHRFFVNTDSFLDAINFYKENIPNNIKILSKEIEHLEKFTAFEIKSKNDKKQVLQLIALGNFTIVLLNQLCNIYAKIVLKAKLSKTNLNTFKNLVLDFEETINDIDMIYFQLRPDKEFQKLIKRAEKVF